jgi:transposase
MRKQAQARYSRQIRELAVRMFEEHAHEHPSRWAALRAISNQIGCSTQSLSTWVCRAEAAADPRVKQLEKANLELRRANEILRKASALFAQAELDR